MAKMNKKYKKARQSLENGRSFSIQDALEQVKKLAYAQFDESVDLDINLGIDASKGDQGVRGSVTLPHSSGAEVRIIVFAAGEHYDKARSAGADFVGVEDLVEKIKGGWMDFDYAVATPDVMGKVGVLAKLLGPRGLLPNKKLGTVTFDVESIVADLKKGRAFFKNDKHGLVHFSIGKVSLDVAQLQDNVIAFVKALSAAKPASSKGRFIKKVTLSSTMGVGVSVNTDELINA